MELHRFYRFITTLLWSRRCIERESALRSTPKLSTDTNKAERYYTIIVRSHSYYNSNYRIITVNWREYRFAST